VKESDFISSIIAQGQLKYESEEEEISEEVSKIELVD
jgi:hypothetical protein